MPQQWHQGGGAIIINDPNLTSRPLLPMLPLLSKSSFRHRLHNSSVNPRPIYNSTLNDQWHRLKNWRKDKSGMPMTTSAQRCRVMNSTSTTKWDKHPKNAQSGMPSLFSCATHAATRSSLISASLSWSKGKPKNLPSRTLLDSSNS